MNLLLDTHAFLWFITGDTALSRKARAASMPFHHRDPFDRLIAAQAKVEQMTLVSADEVFDEYEVTRLW